ncbi:MAG: YkgJ family cysteine cluster protein [Desulfuromonadales bacterium]|nr:YkgJ family cysteine cluster protein [Desulfuromonadales bacterium]MDW7756631.1 YkgJ family cysteine cluster protein [Desulfuromonadales bacterium]
MTSLDEKMARWPALKEAVGEDHNRLERDIATWCEDYGERGGKIHCGRGCRNCCTLHVDVSLTEALLVSDALSAEQAAAVASTVERMTTELAGVDDFKTFLRHYRQRVGACPFLGADGACTVYAVRPFACRALLSTRPADWCAVDFAELTPLERTLFMDSLDRAVVAFPTHYVEATQEQARVLETTAILAMRETFGVAVSGNLPYLVHLQRQHGLGEALAQGEAAVRELLHRDGIDSPFLVHLHL